MFLEFFFGNIFTHFSFMQTGDDLGKRSIELNNP